MTMFLIQSILLLLAAFLLGYGVGRWLKGVFCKRKQVQTQTQTKTEPAHVRVPVTSGAVTTGTAAAALARSREPVAKPTVTVKQPEVQTPTISTKTPELKATMTAAPTVNVTIPKSEVKVTPSTVNVQPPVVDLPKVEVKAPVVDLPKVEVKAPVVDLPKVEINAPKVDVTLPTVEVKLPEVDAPKIEVKDIATGIIGLGAAAMSVAAVKMNAPDGEVDLTVSELVKPPASELDLKTLQMNIPESQTDLSAVEWHNKDVSVDAVAVNVPHVQVDLPDANLPRMDVGLSAANLHTPEGKVDFTALRVDVPDTALHLPAAGIDTEHAQVGAGVIELNTPTGLYTVEGAKVQTLEQGDGAVAVRLTKPDGDVQVASFATDAQGQVSLAAVDPSSAELQTFEIGSLQTGLVNQDWLASLKAAALAQGNTILAGAADQAIAAQAQPLVTSDIASGSGLSAEWLDGLKAAAATAGVGAVVTKAVGALGDLPKPVDESDLIEGAKTFATNLERGNDLLQVEIGTIGQGLNPAFLGSLQTAASPQSTEPVNLIATTAEQIAALPKAIDESDLIEGAKTLTEDIKRHTDLVTVDVGSASGLSPDFLAGLKAAASGAGIAASLKVANSLADLPKPVDASDVIEGAKTVVDDLQRNTEFSSVETLANQPESVDESGKGVADAVLNPAGLSVQDIGSFRQGLSTDTLSALTVAAASTSTAVAIKANLDSGVQPMIVDESDAIEAIKLVWDGELSPAELAALEHTLILRPGETGHLGTVTCSVPGPNCVALGGLEGELSMGDAVRSKLFNMAVTHNDDGNYVFSSLSKWLPDWIRSDDYSDHTSEMATLVWDDDPQAIEQAAGYQLILQEGQYGNLGLVSCAVNEAGSVSLGGLVGSVAEGQTAVSKLYGILVERAGDIYTFKQFANPVTDGSWSTTAKTAALAVGAGVAAQATGAMDTVKTLVMPVTTSEMTDMLEPDLDWDDDKIRIGVHRLIAESHNRRGSKLVSQLWDGDSGYDCGVIEGEESLILKPGLYGKLGSVHCGVTKPGRVVVSGDVSALAEGEGVLFHLYNIVVCRDDEDNYRFERLTDLV